MKLYPDDDFPTSSLPTSITSLRSVVYEVGWGAVVAPSLAQTGCELRISDPTDAHLWSKVPILSGSLLSLKLGSCCLEIGLFQLTDFQRFLQQR